MDNVNSTLYIPLYGKAFVSKKGILLHDTKAEEIWDKQTVKLKRKSKSKYLAYYMGMRSAVFDKWLENALDTDTKDTVVLHLGCGLDSRVTRIKQTKVPFFDVDFPTVIQERKQYYAETDTYRMIEADITTNDWLNQIPNTKRAIVIMEGVSMYVTNQQLQTLFSRLSTRFASLSLLVDCYTPFAAKMSKIKNPVNDVGVTKVYGVASPTLLEKDTALTFVNELEITPKYLINELCGIEKRIFATLYAGKMAKKLYKLYQYQK